MESPQTYPPAESPAASKIWTHRLLLLLLLILAALPAFLPISLISHDGVNMPFYDQWDPDIANVIIHAHQGKLTLWDFFVQHNEHRILVPKIVYAILDSFTGWNQFGEMTATFVIVCLTSLGILILCRGAAALDSPDPPPGASAESPRASSRPHAQPVTKSAA